MPKVATCQRSQHAKSRDLGRSNRSMVRKVLNVSSVAIARSLAHTKGRENKYFLKVFCDHHAKKQGLYKVFAIAIRKIKVL